MDPTILIIIVIAVVIVLVPMVLNYVISNGANKVSDKVGDAYHKHKEINNPNTPQLLALQYKHLPEGQAAIEKIRAQGGEAAAMLAMAGVSGSSASTGPAAVALPGGAVEDKGTIFCPSCGKELPKNASFCPGCGTTMKREPEPERVELAPEYVEPAPEYVEPEPVVQAASQAAPQFCPKCGKPIKPGNVFCGKCGHDLRALNGLK